MKLLKKSQTPIKEYSMDIISQDDLINAEMDKIIVDTNNEPLIADDPPRVPPVQLSKLLEEAIPSNRGLYPHELFMLSLAYRYKTDGNEFLRFWRTSYGVDNPQLILDSLCERGFIEPADVITTIENWKTDDIKRELKKHGLKISGKKADLISRLVDAVGRDVLSEQITERYFALTELGELELNDNIYIQYRHYGLSIWELNRFVAKGTRSVQQVVEDFLIKQCKLHAKHYDFGCYRNARRELCGFLINEKRYSEAFDICVSNIYSELSFLTNGMKSYFTTDQCHKVRLPWICYVTPYERSLYKPLGASCLKSLQTEMNLSDQEFRGKLADSFSKVNIPKLYLLFTKEECVEIVLAELRSDKEYLNSVYAIAEKRKQEELEMLKNDRGLMQSYFCEIRDYTVM